MPNIRCRYYDPETGAPHGGGCRKGAACDFVHPSHPQWAYARIPKVGSRPNFDRGRQKESDRDRERPPSDAGWAARSISGDEGSRRAGPSRSGAMSPPTQPRRQRESASNSGWGTAPITGSDWPPADDGTGANTNANTNGSGFATSSWADTATGGGWSTPPDAGWGGSTDTGWGASTGGGWGEPSASSAGQISSAPAATSAAPVTASPAQMSPDRERASNYIWGDPKGKGKESEATRTPHVGLNTPQYSNATPRTPRSPNRSPPRNSRRKASASASASAFAVATAAAAASPTDYIAMANEVRREDEGVGMRLSRTGVFVPVVAAVATNAPNASSSRKNPFAFPAYIPAEKMVVSRTREEESVVADVDMGEAEGDSPESSASERDIPSDLLHRWKDYLHTLSRAISYNLECRALEDARQRQKNLHAAYSSASLVAVHDKLKHIEADTETKLATAKRRRDGHMKRLARFPLEGLPAPSGDDPRLANVQEIDKYVEQTKVWMDEMRTKIDQIRENVRTAEEARQRVEDENRRIEAERKRAAEEAEALAVKQAHAAKWMPINSLCKTMEEMDLKMGDLDERVTDVELEIDRVRQEAASAQEAVTQRLVELGYLKPDRAAYAALARSSVEEGEVPFEPPAPPKSNEELTEECELLVKKMDEYNDLVVRGLEQVSEWRQRNITKERSYHELAADNAKLQITMAELLEMRKQQTDLSEQQDQEVAEIRALLKRYEAERPPPPPAPPTSDEIAARLLSIVLPKLRGDVQESVGRLRWGVDECTRKQQEVVCEKIYHTIHPALRIVQTVQQFMDRQPEVQMPPPPLPPMMMSTPMPPPHTHVQSVQH